MKTLSILIILLIATLNYSYSQTSFGPKAGINISNINNSISDTEFPTNLNNKPGYYLGAFAQKEFNNSLILRAELLYSLKGAFYDNYRGNDQLKTYENLRYINLPLLIGFRPIRNITLLAENISVLVGAELGYFFERWTFSKDMAGKRMVASGRLPSGYQAFDKALTAGVSYKFNSSLEVEARYNYGFKNIFSDIEAGANRVFQFGMAYHFFQSPAKTGNSKLLINQKTPRFSF